MNNYYSEEELKEMGFASVGKDVFVSRHSTIYHPEMIELGNNIRIDDFCILSGKIKLHDNIHIAPYCGLFSGDAGIEMHDFAGLSSRCAVYAISDDYSGEGLTNPTIPVEYRKVTSKPVVFEKHALVGTGCTVLPGVTIGEGTTVWSMSLVSHNLKPWSMYFGIPCKRVGDRSKKMLEFEKAFLNSKK